MKGQGNLSFRSVYKKTQKGSEMHFMAVKKWRTRSGLIDSYFKDYFILNNI